MSIAEQIQTIRHGLFANNYEPLAMRQILDNGTQTVVNWERIRPAVMALDQMPWHELDPRWQFFLNEERYPIGRTMDLRPDEVETFQNLVQDLIDNTHEPMRILMSVHPEVTLFNLSVTLDSTNLETLEKGIQHVRRVTELAAIDDAITVSETQPGSIEFFLTAGAASILAIEHAILLAKIWKSPHTRDMGRRLWRLAQRTGNDNLTKKDAIDSVMDDAKEAFWEDATEPLENALQNATNKNFPEAKNKIDAAAKEIYQNAEPVSADWRLPPVVIRGLPNGLTASLYYDDPESIARVIKALAEAPDSQECS